MPDVGSCLDQLRGLDGRLRQVGDELAIFLVYDRPARVTDRPGLARLYFAQRCLSDEQLDDIIGAHREIGAYVELFDGERPFLEALASGRLAALGRAQSVVYNGIGWGVGPGGFMLGRKALVPLVADSHKLLCANADAYACAFTLHKFHCFTVLRSLGIDAPATWQWRIGTGWVAGQRPSTGTVVIVKSAYEAWSVGVTTDSVFAAADDIDERVAGIAEAIGQDVVVQEFVAGRELYVPVLSAAGRVVLPPVDVTIERAPGDPGAVLTVDDVLSDAVSYTVSQLDAVSRAMEQAAGIVDILQLDGLSRIDFRVDQHGRPRVFDIAISPGLSRASAAYTSASSLGLSHAEFVRLPVAAALARAGRLPD